MKGDGMGGWRALRSAVCVMVALYLLAPLVIATGIVVSLVR